MNVRLKEKASSQVKLKKLEEKLKYHNERIKKIKREGEEKKTDSIMDLFKKMYEEKEDSKLYLGERYRYPLVVPVPSHFKNEEQEKQQEKGRSLNEIREEERAGVFSLTDVVQVRKKKEAKKARNQVGWLDWGLEGQPS